MATLACGLGCGAATPDDGAGDGAVDPTAAATTGETDGPQTPASTGDMPDGDDVGDSGDDGDETGALPGDGPPGHGDPADVPEHQALLDEIEGWASGTTGGLAGTVFVVDTLDDDGPRSLRAGLQATEPLWIVFADGLDGTIELQDTVHIGSDKTVDARGHAIHVRTRPGDFYTPLRITGQTNVVLTNLRIDDEYDGWDADSEGGDGLNITNSDHVWVHHCTFERWIDGAIDIKHDPSAPGELPHHISVTFSHFGRVYQALNWTADQISFGHNRCEKVRRRCIQILDGRGHSYNNLISDWNAATIQHAKRAGAQLYAQRNMFEPDGFGDVNQRTDGGKIRTSNNHAFGNVNFLGGSDGIDESFVDESELNAVVVACGDGDDACWNALRDDVIATAGVQ